MAKRQSKAEQILIEARNRLLTAKNQVFVAEGVLSQAAAALRAHQDAYDALEKALAPKPRKKPATPAAQATLPTDKDEKEQAGPKCGVCANGEDFLDHFPPSPHYHKFEPVAAAAKKSSRKNGSSKASVSSIPSLETHSEGVGSAVQEASSSASAGD